MSLSAQQTTHSTRYTTPNTRYVPHLAALLAYLLLTLVMTWPLIAVWSTAIPGDSFDGWQNYWNQWWIKVALVDRLQNPFHTDLLYYPTGVDLYFHTLNPFNGVTTLPIQLSWGLIPAYNTVVLLSWVLAGYGVYLLVLQQINRSRAATLTPSTTAALSTMAALSTTAARLSPVAHHLAAFIAGAIFTFAPFHMAHLLGHMQVMSLEWIPFYVLYLLRATDQQQAGRPWRRSALMAGLFLTLTGLCDWYFVLYLFFFTGLVLVGALFTRRVTVRRRINAIGPPIVAGAIMVVLLSPLLIPMVRAASQFSFMVRPTTDLYILSASVLDFLVPNRLHTLFRPESFTWPGNQIAPVSERTIAIGYLALALALVAVWPKERGVARSPRRALLFWSWSALFFFLLALGPRWHGGNITAAMIPDPGTPPTSWTPFGLLNATIPFMRISRSVSRYALMVQLSVAVLAGMGSAYLLQRISRQREDRLFSGRRLLPPLLVATGLLSLVLFESWVAPFPMSPPDTPGVYNELTTLVPDVRDDGALLNLPMNYDRPGYLLYQTVHHRPLAVAYISRDDPRTLTERVPLFQHWRHLGPDIIEVDPAVVGLTVLHDLGIAIVVQDRYKMPGGLEREYTAALANALFAGQAPRYEDDRVTVHAVPPLAQAEPYLMLGALNWGPLEVTGDDTRRRLVGAIDASLHIEHSPPRVGLELQYRSVSNASLAVYALDGVRSIAVLPPAPAGKRVTLTLDGEVGLILRASTADGVWIEGLRLTSEK